MNALKKYESACNKLANDFAKKQEVKFSSWVNGEIGDVAIFNEHYFFSMHEIILDIKHKAEKGKILDYFEMTLNRHKNGKSKSFINYRSYLMGLRYEDLKE